MEVTTTQAQSNELKTEADVSWQKDPVYMVFIGIRLLTILLSIISMAYTSSMKNHLMTEIEELRNALGQRTSEAPGGSISFLKSGEKKDEKDDNLPTEIFNSTIYTFTNMLSNTSVSTTPEAYFTFSVASNPLSTFASTTKFETEKGTTVDDATVLHVIVVEEFWEQVEEDIKAMHTMQKALNETYKRREDAVNNVSTAVAKVAAAKKKLTDIKSQLDSLTAGQSSLLNNASQAVTDKINDLYAKLNVMIAEQQGSTNVLLDNLSGIEGVFEESQNQLESVTNKVKGADSEKKSVALSTELQQLLAELNNLNSSAVSLQEKQTQLSSSIGIITTIQAEFKDILPYLENKLTSIAEDYSTLSSLLNQIYQQTKCPVDAKHFEDICYLLPYRAGHRVDSAAAKKICEFFNAQLVEFPTEDSYEAVKKYVRLVFSIDIGKEQPGYPHVDILSGGSYQASQGYVLSNGETGYTLWQPDYPKSGAGFHLGVAIILDPDSDQVEGMWTANFEGFPVCQFSVSET